MSTTDLPFLAPIPLSGYGVSLRAIEPGDAPDIYATCQDPVTIEWTTIPHPYLMEHAKSFATNPPPRAWIILAGANDGGRDAATSDALEPGSYCGTIELRVHSPKMVSLGYMTAPWARGRGIMTAAVRLVRDYVFSNGIARLELCAYPDNIASRRVAEKAGMQFEGILRGREIQRGKIRDVAMYSSIPADLE